MSAELTIVNSTLERNYATTGGALFIIGSNINLYGVICRRNQATAGGAFNVVYGYDLAPTCENCEF